MGTLHNHSDDPARTGIQRLRDGLTTSAALGATITVVAGTVLVNGQPVGADPVGGPTEVTSLDDEINGDATTSLREALANAEGNAGPDTITFAPALFAGGPAVIEIGSTLRTFAHDVTITGPGADQLTVRAVDESEEGEDVTAFYFYGDVAVSISNISIEATGSGIEAYGYYDGSMIESVTLSGVDIEARREAVSISTVSGDVTITDSTLTNSEGGNGPIAAIYNAYGNVALTDVDITEAEAPIVGDGFVPFAEPRLGLIVERAASIDLTRVTTDTSYDGVLLRWVDGDVEVSDSEVTSDTGGLAISYAGDVDLTDSTVTKLSDGMYVGRSFGPRRSAAVSIAGAGDIDIDTVSIDGGGVQAHYSSSLDITSSTITDSSTGAIHSVGVPLHLSDSTISNNAALYGTALIEAGGDGRRVACLDLCLDGAAADAPGLDGPGDYDSITIINTTISDNDIHEDSTIIRSFERYSGDFLDSADEPYTLSGVQLLHSTIAGNAVADEFPYGPPPLEEPAPAVVEASSVVIDHSIVTDNDGMDLIDPDAGVRLADASGLGDATSLDGGLSPITASHSILPAAYGPVEGTNVFADDPGLGRLTDNGGPTETMLPDLDSPAVDAGAAGVVISIDQRGEDRPSGEASDIGSVERQASSISISADPATVAESDGTVTLTVTRTGDGEGDASVRVSTADGTATAGDDYTALDQVVVLPAGQATTTVDLLIASDDDVEPDETLTVTMSEADNVTIDVASVEVTITDSTTPTTTTPTTVPTSTTPTTTPSTTVPDATTTTTTTPLQINGDNPPPVAGGSESSFTVIIEQGDDEEVGVSAKSSNPGLLEVVSVQRSGQGNAFTRGSAELTEVQYEVRVRAAAGGSGTATVTVTAVGESGTVTQDFEVVVSSQTLPATGSDTTQRTGLIGALLLGFGFVTSLFSRRRRA